jgi:Ca2+-binding EF-hand superfamily protein
MSHFQFCCRYEEWLAAMLEWRSLQESDEWDAWVEQGFKAFDVDGSGTIGVQALQGMLCKGGVCLMPDVVAAALRCVAAGRHVHRRHNFSLFAWDG